jgi:ribosomal protein S4
MNFIRRWRHRPEKGQEQLLVRLWTTNSMNADAEEQLTRTASKLAFDAKVELKASLKYLSSAEIEETVTDAACSNLIAHRLRKHLNDGRRGR